MSDRTKKTRNPLGSIFTRSIKKQGKKITVYDVRKRYCETVGGRKIWKSKTQRCYSYSEALLVLSNMPGRVESERRRTSRPHTLAELVDYYRQEYCRAAVFSGERQISGFRQDPKTIEKYLDEYQDYFGAERQVESITYEDLRAFAVHLQTTPINPGYRYKIRPARLPSAATVNRKLAYLRRLMNVGKQLRWLTVSPFTEGKPLINAGAERARERVLTYDEEKRLLAACELPDTETVTWRGREVTYERDNQRPHLRLILILAIDTGLRKKELFSLQRSEIKLREGIIDLTARKTKALKRRIIVISPRLEKEFTKYFDRFAFHPNAPIFFGQRDADKAFATACRKAGIKNLTFHDLRHTATTWMDEAGISQAVKQYMIGHASDRVHQAYHNPSPDIVKSVRAKMEEFERRKA
jgi:integrase